MAINDCPERLEWPAPSWKLADEELKSPPPKCPPPPQTTTVDRHPTSPQLIAPSLFFAFFVSDAIHNPDYL